MLGTLITFFAVGIIALLMIGLALSVMGWVVGTAFSLAFGLAGVILLKIAPLVLLGWLALKLLERRRRPGELSPADRKWLEGRG